MFSDTALSSEYFNLSTLHFMVTSCPTLRPLEGRGRKPTARQGSSTGLCKPTAHLNVKCSVAFSVPLGCKATGLCAPTFLLPKILYFIFNILSSRSFLGSSEKEENTSELFKMLHYSWTSTKALFVCCKIYYKRNYFSKLFICLGKLVKGKYSASPIK